jgi:hypothetical protein
MKIHLRRVSWRSAQLLLVLAALTGSSSANDWYVDPINGSNANSGNAPAQAWRTITFALHTPPAAPTGRTHVIHLAPGVYGAASGEVFPIALRDAFQIVGDEGADVTVLDAGGAESVLYAYLAYHYGGNYTGPLTLVKGVTLQNAAVGIDLATNVVNMDFTAEDVRITGMSTAGIQVLSLCSIPCGAFVTKLVGVEITGCQVGIDAETSGQFNQSASMSLEDCDVSGNIASGIRHHSTGQASVLSLQRVRMVGNGLHGLELDEAPVLSGSMSNALTDCLLARNLGSGIHATTSTTGLPIGLNLSVVRCTIAGNAAGGLDAFYTTMSIQADLHTALTSSILFGNGDDVIENPAHLSIESPAFNDIGDGEFAGSNGNIAADPLFRDAATGDYRLRWGSPCIDAGDPATPAGALDLSNVKRPVDGNLDAQEIADMGAFEFTPLAISRSAHVGKNLVLEQWGPSGGTATLFLARGFPEATPQSTPFGDFDLDPTAYRNLGVAPIAPGPPALRSIPIPNDPLYIGKTFSFQALSTSSVPSPAMAYTNPVTVTVLP